MKLENVVKPPRMPTNTNVRNSVDMCSRPVASSAGEQADRRRADQIHRAGGVRHRALEQVRKQDVDAVPRHRTERAAGRHCQPIMIVSPESGISLRGRAEVIRIQ